MRRTQQKRPQAGGNKKTENLVLNAENTDRLFWLELTNAIMQSGDPDFKTRALKDIARIKERIGYLKEKNSALHEEKKPVITLLRKGLISESEAQSHLEEINGQMASITNKLINLESSALLIEHDLEKFKLIDEIISAAGRRGNGLTFREKRTVVQQLVEKITVFRLGEKIHLQAEGQIEVSLLVDTNRLLFGPRRTGAGLSGVSPEGLPTKPGTAAAGPGDNR